MGKTTLVESAWMSGTASIHTALCNITMNESALRLVDPITERVMLLASAIVSKEGTICNREIEKGEYG